MNAILKSGTPHYGYVIVLCCCLIMAVNVGLVMSCAGIFYQPISRELDISVGKFGLYMSFNYLTSTFMLSVAGRLMERFSVRLLLTLASAVLGVCLLAMSTFNAVWQFYAAGSVIGICMAFLLYLSFPTLINRWFNVRVGFFIGVCSAASGIGGILFNPIGARLIENYGWRTTYLIFGGIILLLVTPLLGVLLRSRPEDKGLLAFGTQTQRQATAPAVGVDYARAIKMPVFYALLLFALLIISVSTLNLFIPNYVVGMSYSLEQASFAASAVMVGVTIGKVALGMINDQSSMLGVLTTAILGAGGLLLLLVGELSIWVVVCGGFLFGWAYAGVTVQTPMLVRTVFGSRHYPQIYSNISIALAAGGAITAGGWGLLSDYVDFKTILSLGALFLALCGCIGIYALRTSKRLQ